MTPTARDDRLDLTKYKALSFDCYGTLIDWETGIAAVLAPWAHEQGLNLSDEELLLAYADNEAAVKRGIPSALYPDVLAMAFGRTGEKLSTPVSEAWAQRLGDSVPDWPAFPDSADALAAGPALQADHPLQLHRAGFAGSNQQLLATSPPSSPPRTSAPTSPPRTTSGPSTPRSPASAWIAVRCCTSRRACSTATSRPSAKGCRPSGSTPTQPPRLGSDPESQRRVGVRPGAQLDGCLRRSCRPSLRRRKPSPTQAFADASLRRRLTIALTTSSSTLCRPRAARAPVPLGDPLRGVRQSVPPGAGPPVVGGVSREREGSASVRAR